MIDGAFCLRYARWIVAGALVLMPAGCSRQAPHSDASMSPVADVVPSDAAAGPPRRGVDARSWGRRPECRFDQIWSGGPKIGAAGSDRRRRDRLHESPLLAGAQAAEICRIACPIESPVNSSGAPSGGERDCQREVLALLASAVTVAAIRDVVPVRAARASKPAGKPARGPVRNTQMASSVVGLHRWSPSIRPDCASSRLTSAKVDLEGRQIAIRTVLAESKGERVSKLFAQQAAMMCVTLVDSRIHCRRGMDRLRLGSSAELLTRIAPVPAMPMFNNRSAAISKAPLRYGADA